MSKQTRVIFIITNLLECGFSVEFWEENGYYMIDMELEVGNYVQEKMHKTSFTNGHESGIVLDQMAKELVRNQKND